MIKNILLAEDERGTALLVKTTLERYGYNVQLAVNGLQALNLALNQSFDLIVTDVVMPEMDGVDLYIELKKNGFTASIPIIIVTDKDVFRDSFCALGVDHFVEKTSDINKLLDKIRSIETLSKETKKYSKILIGGSKEEDVKHIARLLSERGCLVASADQTIDVIAKAFTVTPHIIILDIYIVDTIKSTELIKALRCFDFLRKTKILIYASLSPEDIGQGNNSIEKIEDFIHTCIEAGADKYIGRFSPGVFVDQMKEHGIF